MHRESRAREWCKLTEEEFKARKELLGVGHPILIDATNKQKEKSDKRKARGPYSQMKMVKLKLKLARMSDNVLSDSSFSSNSLSD